MSTVTPGQVAGIGSFIGYNYGPDANFPPIYLTGAKITANAASFPTLTFAAYGSLEIRLHIIGYSASDLGSIRFNADSGANYWNRNMTAVAGGVVFVDTPQASDSQLRFGIAGTAGVVAVYNITNQITLTKCAVARVMMGTGAAATPGTAVVSCAGEWINTAAQITTLNVQVVGANNFLANSTVQVYGGL